MKYEITSIPKKGSCVNFITLLLQYATSFEYLCIDRLVTKIFCNLWKLHFRNLLWLMRLCATICNIFFLYLFQLTTTFFLHENVYSSCLESQIPFLRKPNEVKPTCQRKAKQKQKKNRSHFIRLFVELLFSDVRQQTNEKESEEKQNA